jgi:cyanophycin synthetase
MLKINKIFYHEGYTSKILHPHFVVSMSIEKFQDAKKILLEFDTIIQQLIPSYSPPPMKKITDAIIIERIAYTIEIFYDFLNYPLLEKVLIVQKENNMEYFIPILQSNINAASQLIRWLVSIMNGNRKDLSQIFAQLLHMCKTSLPQGVNAYRILRLAQENNIPWKMLDQQLFQLGWGSNSRFFKSTHTDQTSGISIALSQNKFFTKKLLQSVGLPVAISALVDTREKAIEVAKKIGYPVVIKPIDQDAGRGVSAGLLSETAMIKAYDKATKFSKNIMIEKHFEGNDHRLHIMNGECYYATQRIYPMITGDGKNTIKYLIQELNAWKKDALPSGIVGRKIIEEDEELFEILEEYNFKLETILGKDKVLKLRRIANVSTGGTSTMIEDLDIIHKDNIELAKRAVKTLRLDIAAVDFLIPDITKSWMDVGGVILEVNSMPQIGHDDKILYALKKLVKNDGRISSVVVVGDNDTKFNKYIVQKLNNKNFNIGISTKNHLYSNLEITSSIPVVSIYSGSLRLVCDPSIDAMLIYVEDPLMLAESLAIDKFDYLIFMNQPNKNMGNEYLEELSRRAGTVIIENGCTIDRMMFKELEKEVLSLGKQEIQDQIINLFLANS